MKGLERAKAQTTERIVEGIRQCFGVAYNRDHVGRILNEMAAATRDPSAACGKAPNSQWVRKRLLPEASVLFYPRINHTWGVGTCQGTSPCKSAICHSNQGNASRDRSRPLRELILDDILHAVEEIQGTGHVQPVVDG